MDPLTTILAALATAGGQLASQVLADGYSGLKAAIVRRFGSRRPGLEAEIDSYVANPDAGVADTQGHGKVAFMQPEAALACAVGRGGGDGWPLLCCPGRPCAGG